MAREPSAAILDPLRRLVGRSAGSAQPDAQLLDNFVTRRDEASFEVLVWRHGAMVLALCKRLLRDAHEAEDAFQATFLVFARKAGSIGRGEVVAAWLYKVAYRIALRLRAASAKRAAAALPTDELPADAGGDSDWADLRPVLDDEIARLPEKYRRPFVLCYLEGRTNEEAAQQLGCPKGTVLSRLSRGRERLRERLARRGVAFSAAAFALTLGQNAAAAAVPAALVSPAVGAAVPFASGKAAAELTTASVAALTEGTLKAMTLVKLKVAAAVVAVVLAGGIAWGVGADERPAPAPERPAARPTAEAQPPRDRERAERPAPALVGKVIEVAKDGKSFTVEVPPTERGGAPGKTIVKLGEKAAVTYQGVGPDGAKPTADYQATVWFEKDSKEVAATVQFTGPAAPRGSDVTGVVTEVAKDGKSFVVEVRPTFGRERPVTDARQVTIPLDARTVLAFSNVGKGEAKLTAGQQAVVWYADDGKAAKVRLSGTVDARAPDQTPPKVVGRVTRTDGKTLVVEVPPATRGEEPKRVTVKLRDDAVTAFHNVPTDGAKVAPELRVQAWLADGSATDVTRALFTGDAPEPWTNLSGKVVAVAKDGSSFTLESTMRGREPERTEVKLTGKTKSVYNGVGPGEAKPAEGLSATVRLLVGSPDTAAQVTFGKQSERGR